MAGNISDYLANDLLDHILNNNSYTSPSDVYLALFTSDPGNSGDMSDEVSAGQYGRQSVSFSSPSSRSTDNNSDIVFNEAESGWGEITHAAICDSSSAGGGNVLFYGPLEVSKTIDAGDQFKINTGDLDCLFTA